MAGSLDALIIVPAISSVSVGTLLFPRSPEKSQKPYRTLEINWHLYLFLSTLHRSDISFDCGQSPSVAQIDTEYCSTKNNVEKSGKLNLLNGDAQNVNGTDDERVSFSCTSTLGVIW